MGKQKYSKVFKFRQSTLSRAKIIFEDSDSYDAKTLIGYCLFIDKVTSNVNISANDLSIQRLENALKELGKNYYTIIQLKYVENMSFRTCGKILGISGARVQIIETKIIDLIRKRLHFILSSEQKEFDDKILAICNKIKSNESLTEDLDILISELSFSSRTTNALTVAGVVNLSQLYQLSKDDLMQIRNLGPKSVQEITDKLQTLFSTSCPIWSNDDIRMLNLHNRIVRNLHQANVTTISHLFSLSDRMLMRIPKLGVYSVNEINKAKQTLLSKGYIIASSCKLSSTTNITDVDFSLRTINSLKKAGIITVSDLLAVSDEDLHSIPYFGTKCMLEVTQFKQNQLIV